MRKRATRCPTCGQAAMHLVTRDVSTRRAGRTVAVKGVEIEECAHCGERLYDLTALRRLAEARRTRPGPRPAA